ncbi:methylated-DNA--[protein]-cysteine S-methyltransferase [Sphingomonas sp. Root1294]|nr:methylated-DNA--[protein]-cysteine S-methyltransferase [Sphingomonas sp. Root1294]KQX21720.1 cysteine methyltransferase [Sphingomonas sp. Root1294]KQY73035.1 cysteine methyltransferase [Sphingomonas sp. Root50]KRB88365.1 cysteine methyltransferase [Sphingomonas sp. Root720]
MTSQMTTLLRSPIGPILIQADGLSLHSIRILAEDDAIPSTATEGPASGPAADAVRQLRAYFDDGVADFDLPLAPAATPRGAALRAAIVAIAAGDTLSYGALARIAGSAPRAIGQACARNPFPIVVPCHRVVGSGGAIGHYSAGRGIITKTWLLDHERRGGLL